MFNSLYLLKSIISWKAIKTTDVDGGNMDQPCGDLLTGSPYNNGVTPLHPGHSDNVILFHEESRRPPSRRRLPMTPSNVTLVSEVGSVSRTHYPLSYVTNPFTTVSDSCNLHSVNIGSIASTGQPNHVTHKQFMDSRPVKHSENPWIVADSLLKSPYCTASAEAILLDHSEPWKLSPSPVVLIRGSKSDRQIKHKTVEHAALSKQIPVRSVRMPTLSVASLQQTDDHRCDVNGEHVTVAPRGTLVSNAHVYCGDVGTRYRQAHFNALDANQLASPSKSLEGQSSQTTPSDLAILTTEMAKLKCELASLVAAKAEAMTVKPIVPPENTKIHESTIATVNANKSCTDGTTIAALAAELSRIRNQCAVLSTNEHCMKRDVKLTDVDVPSTSFPSSMLKQTDDACQSSVQTSVRRPARDMKPQQFDGKEPVDSFLAHFEVCSNFNRWDNDEKRDWLHWSLKGRAQQLLWDMPTCQRGTYDGTVHALRQRYGSETQCEVYRMDLRNRRRGSRENLSDLMQDIRRLMILGYGSESSPMWESVAANAFLDALNDPVLALEVRKRNVTTLDGAYREAALLEGFSKASTRHENTRREQVRVVGCQNGNTSTVSKDNTAVNNAVQQMQSKQTAFEQQIAQTQQTVNQMQAMLQQFMFGNGFGQPTTYSASGTQSRVGGQMEPRGRCFNCNELGHHARACPNRQIASASVNAHSNGQTEQHGSHNRAIARKLQSARTAYLPVNICGKSRWALLDTGCEVTVFAARHLQGVEVQTTNQRLTAANGSDIEVLGETEVSLVVGNQIILTKCLVSEYVDELILGLDWLESHKCVWDFGARNIVVDGQRYKLFAHQPTWRVRRVVLHESTVIPARSEHTVEANTVYADLIVRRNHWASTPTKVTDGVYAARSLVVDQPQGVRLRVVNVSNSDITLEKGINLGHLEAVSVIEECNYNQDNALNDIEYLTPVLETVDESVGETDRERLRDLLQEYAMVFSKGDHDLGKATAVQHSINTGSNKPVRQPLRRQPLHLAAAADEQIQSMLQQGVIQPSHSDWSSNLVMVKKRWDFTLLR